MHTAALPDPQYQPEFYADISPKRLMAWLIDVGMILGMTLLILPFTAFIGLFFLPFLYASIGFVYRVLTIAGSSGTLGMRVMSVELRTASGNRMDIGSAFLHTLGYYLSFGMALAQLASVVLMLTSERGQSLTDMVLGTVMLNRRI
ncbi:RDD family protein [Marinovum sp. 2_MG-2023]|uniref:RDD family protein n=1 Tax=Roseobacteraceae TaxID=2854170 RepID=UPI001FD140BE|nr:MULTISPECIES: RDD family protein [Roseobacteraceae]MCJ7873609.1 RDD family protein [Phaeobacter sp. J2-8]MDO6730390.1 RDD family protein [Marinovum sp. 2_MG-2023]MDO6778370.1 RDD family protein [Marinovum sp. 1_MG-2023]